MKQFWNTQYYHECHNYYVFSSQQNILQIQLDLDFISQHYYYYNFKNKNVGPISFERVGEAEICGDLLQQQHYCEARRDYDQRRPLPHHPRGLADEACQRRLLAHPGRRPLHLSQTRSLNAVISNGSDWNDKTFFGVGDAEFLGRLDNDVNRRDVVSSEGDVDNSRRRDAHGAQRCWPGELRLRDGG